MLSFFKNQSYSIGVDVGDDIIKVAQLKHNGNGLTLVGTAQRSRPAEVKAGSSDWQRWAIEAVCELTSNGGFQGRQVTAAMPPNEVFIDQVRMPKFKEAAEEAVLSKIKQKLPFESGDAMIKCIPSEGDEVVVVAIEQKKIDRHLAIYEEAHLKIESMGIWPIALVNTYVKFFGRRKSDSNAVVMLLEIDEGNTNAVICRHKNLLFARSLPIGSKELTTDETVTRLVLELNSYKQRFTSSQGKSEIERLIFLSGQMPSRDVCAAIAKHLEMPAQTGDCLAAVAIDDPCRAGIERRGPHVNWSTAFGLSLSEV